MTKRKRKRIPIHRPDAIIAAPPGTLTPPAGSIATRISVFAYGPTDFIEEEIRDLSRLELFVESHPVVWVDVVGLGTLSTLTELRDRFALHRLAMEDVLNIPQRPKLDDYGDHRFIVARMPIADTHLETEQLSIFFGKNFVVTFQEQPGDRFDAVRSRIREGRARIRESGPDYLVYSLLDGLVDSYFPLLEYVRVALDSLEEKVYHDPEKAHVQELFALKRDLVTLRRYLEPLRDLNASLIRPDHAFLSESTRIYMRDCYDHSLHALHLVESYRDIASGLMDLYLSMVSQRMNEVMKVLTIIATVFIPLSFVAGLYGMNFDPQASRWNMPELSWPFGYAFAIGIMTLCAGGMLYYFWRKGWFR
jgi:magnesium transporter